MIEMGVAVEQDFHILQLEAQRLDVLLDEGRGFRQGAIGQDQPIGGGDQEGADALHPDIIDVADDAERGVRPVPVQPFFAEGGLGRSRPARQQQPQDNRAFHESFPPGHSAWACRA